MTSLAPPISSFPMNTAGVHFLRPNALSSLSSCGPFGCSSSSWTLGFAPNVWISFMMLWDMQQDVLLKITTGVSAPRLMTIAITDVNERERDRERWERGRERDMRERER